MRLTDLNREAVPDLLKDADRYLHLAEAAATPGLSFLKSVGVVNLRSGYSDLTKRGMLLMMTDFEQTEFQFKLDRLKDRLRTLGQSV